MSRHLMRKAQSPIYQEEPVYLYTPQETREEKSGIAIGEFNPHVRGEYLQDRHDRIKVVGHVVRALKVLAPRHGRDPAFREAAEAGESLCELLEVPGEGFGGLAHDIRLHLERRYVR